MRGNGEGGPLPSWNEGPAKQSILDFVRATTDPASPDFVPTEQRIAVFDQDGTLWAEQPMPSQVFYCLDRLPAVVAARPELKDAEPFKTLLGGNPQAMAKLGAPDLMKLAYATLTGMTTDTFAAEVQAWLAAARDRRWNRPYTELIYQPMLEVLVFLREHGFKTCMVTGGGQDFVRIYAEQVYGIAPEHVVGSTAGTKFAYDEDGAPRLNKEPTLLALNDHGGKPEGIHLGLGRRPLAAFGNSTGDKEMLDWTGAGAGARLGVLLLHDDAEREYAYGPINNMPTPMIGEFTQDLHDHATSKGWTVISMKRDWRRVFPFDSTGSQP